jgi:glutamate--cysteine ligase
MASQLKQRIDALAAHRDARLLARLTRGIEKESLRVLPSGNLSQTSHPVALGSALTHPLITTDFCESQPELITGVHTTVEGCLDELCDIHRFVYGVLDDELLWSSSMPCMLGQDDQVPIATYGQSNVGRTKNIYRRGLGARYGRLMQTISGIHYNFSIPDPLWSVIAQIQGTQDTRGFRDDAYFSLIRNFRRHSWLLIYLFGASPSLCKSFVKGKPHNLESFDEGSLFVPQGTSLRMGRLGYTSDAQSSLHVSYNSLAQYANSLLDAMTRPYPPYERIGVKVDGEYRQLSTTLLQIENEFYGTIRPKRSTAKNERPIAALTRSGVEYVEVRCIDLNPFLPVGIDAEEIRFIDTFLLHCLLSDSPPDSLAEAQEMSGNQQRIVEAGRKPGVTLGRGGQDLAMRDWAQTLMNEMRPIAGLLDRAGDTDLHIASWKEQIQRLDDADRTPSARILASMRKARVPFFRFAMNQSILHKGYFDANPLSEEKLRHLGSLADRSISEQRAIEAADSETLDAYLARYMAAPSIGDS